MHDETKLLQILTETCPGVDFTKEIWLWWTTVFWSHRWTWQLVCPEIMATFDIELNVDDLLPENFNSASHAPFDPEPKKYSCLLRLQNLSAFSR